MALERGDLAKIDRRVFAELDGVGSVRVVKVPVSDAAWSTWRRYCDALGFTMGQGIAGLIASTTNSGPSSVLTQMTGQYSAKTWSRSSSCGSRCLMLENVASTSRNGRFEPLGGCCGREPFLFNRQPVQKWAAMSHAHAAQASNTNGVMPVDSPYRLRSLCCRWPMSFSLPANG